MTKKVLECSSKGDKRFSAMFAQVKAFGVMDTIENHYQKCKRDADGNPVKKGQPVNHIVLIRRNFSAEMLTPWYRMLWIKYLDQNPELVAHAKQFDEFTDMFRSSNMINCQADVIKAYITDREQLLQSVSSLSGELRQITNRIKHYRQIIANLICAFEDGSMRLEDFDSCAVSRLLAILEGRKKCEEELPWDEIFPFQSEM